jgi:hypothetical protein
MKEEKLREIDYALKSAGCECDALGVFIDEDYQTATCPLCGKCVNIPLTIPAAPTKTYQLTDEEAAAVDAIRAQHAHESMRNFMAQHLLDTAASYYLWLRANGAGSTFSTFCDDYDYQPPSAEMSRKPIYDAVARLVADAREAAAKLAG